LSEYTDGANASYIKYESASASISKRRPGAGSAGAAAGPDDDDDEDDEEEEAATVDPEATGPLAAA